MINLDLSKNILSGTIPSTLWKLSSLNSLDISNNQLTGTIPHTIGLLESINELNLSNNKLSGTITTEMSKLKKLSALNLSKNHLTMGSEVQVPPSTFSIATLQSRFSSWDFNCLHWTSPVWGNQVYLPVNCAAKGMYYG
jgi:Leucine-rich repeat (LRR) protein